MKNDLLTNLIKHSAIRNALGSVESVKASSYPGTSSQKQSIDDIFKLPPVAPLTSVDDLDESVEYESDYEDSDDSANNSPRKNSKWAGNIHQVDVTCSDFKNLPADVRYDILTDLKETRKQNSWGRIHEMPEVRFFFIYFLIFFETSFFF